MSYEESTTIYEGYPDSRDPMVKRKDRTLTKSALRKKRKAMVYAREAACGNGVHPRIEEQIATLDGEAEDMIQRKATWLTTPGGEIPATTAPSMGYGPNRIMNTLTSQGETRIAEDASIARMDLLIQDHLDCAPTALDAAESIEARNSLEKMLVHEMAAAHEAAMRFLDRSMVCASRGETVECARYANLSARFMAVYQTGLLTLHKIRGGGQSITVQHVTIGPNSQAVVGNVQTGADAGNQRKTEGDKG
jgi:hypothetical protein